MQDWFLKLDDRVWLQPDDTGEAQARFLQQALGLQPKDTVLDVPCGAGRIAVPLARLGCAVTGVDLRDGFVGLARERAFVDLLDAQFMVGDMRDIDFNAQFNAAINFGGSFGYFSDDENREVLRRLARAVYPGGRVLIDQPNREWLLRHFRANMQTEHATIENTWNARAQRVEGAWTLERDDVTRREYTSIRLYTPQQLHRLLDQAGMAWEAVYGDPLGGPYSPRNAHRMIVVARRHGSGCSPGINA